MPYVPLIEHLNEIAKKETRKITLLTKDNEFQLPEGEYSFLELFCDECDCRRVMFAVIKKEVRTPLAGIYWGWESESFYKKEFSSIKINVKKELIGPGLNMGSPQSMYAEKILKMFSKVLLNDKDYIDRVKRHYELFRKKVDKGS